MIHLVDTHYLLWSVLDSKKIPANIHNILENQSATKLVSGINLWEISLKFSLGKLRLGDETPDNFFAQLLKIGFEQSPIENDLLATFYQLPVVENHHDPFDRMLIWQAIKNDYVILTQDQKFTQYQPFGLRLELGR